MSDVTRQEAIRLLTEEYGVKGISNISKTDAINMLEKKQQEILNTVKDKNEDPDQIFFEFSENDIIEDLQNIVNSPEKIIEENITFQDQGWTEFILKQLYDNEKVEQYPTTNGLRRLFEKYVGTIIDSDIDVISPPSDTNKDRATVKCKITYRTFDNDIRSISDAADCFWGNSQKPYSLHPTATASTLAEGRCYRKGLRIITQTQEELLGPKDAEESENLMRDAAPATSNQKMIIDKKVKKLNLNINKILQEQVRTKNSFNEINYSEAQYCMNILNKYERGPEQGGLTIPQDYFIDE